MCGSGGRHETALGKMAAQGIDRLHALANQTVPGLVGYRGCLLRLGLYRHKPHRRPRRRFRNCLGIRHVVLLPLHERLHIG